MQEAQNEETPDFDTEYVDIDLEDSEGYFSFREVANRLGGGQVQYISHYATGVFGAPDFSQGLRLRNLDGHNYHAYRIHKDDIDTFVQRIRDHRERRL